MATAAPVHAQSDGDNSESQARTLYAQAAERYRDGEFETSIVLLREAIRLHDAPAFHHNLARAQQEVGNWAEAHAEYQLFLERDPETDERTRVEARMALMQERMDEAERLEAAETAVRAAALEEEANAAPPEELGASVDPIPWIVASTSVVPFGLAIVFGVLVDSEVSAAREASSQVEAQPHVDSADTYALVANILFPVGGALALAGVIWGIVSVATSEPASAEETHVSLRIGPTGGALVGRF